MENVKDRGIFFLSLSSCQYTDEKFCLLQCTEEKAATSLPPPIGFSLRDNKGSVYLYEKGDSLLGLCPQLEASLQWIDLPLLLCILEILCLVPLMIRILRYESRKTGGKTLLQNTRGSGDSLFVPNDEGVTLFLHSHHPSALTSLYKPRSTKKCGD